MSFKTLEAWLDWQASCHPTEIELGLDRVRQVAARLGVLEFDAKVMIVGGTNGKGSSVALAESILKTAGYQTGCYTSPHILHYRERIRLDGTPVDDEIIVEAFNAIDGVRGDVSLTYFEWGTLAALWIFHRAALDVVLLEVGLGGRLDAVNIVDPDVALITSIGIDHTDWLGETRAAISLEKAGIARAGKPLVCADLESPPECIQYLNELEAELLLRGDDFDLTVEEQSWTAWGPDWRLDKLPKPGLAGQHQLNNALGVLQAVHSLGLPGISDRVIHSALQQVTLSGRFERINGSFELVLDVAHNADGSRRLAETLSQTPIAGATWCLLGVLNDKDAETMLAALDKQVEHWVLTEPDSPRALSRDLLEEIYLKRSRSGVYEMADTVEAGFELVRGQLSPKDRLLVTGSFYTVGQVKAVLENES